MAGEEHKLPPQNIEAEQSVLGAILLDNKVIPEVQEIIAPDDFYRDAHQKIFTAMVDMASNNAIDLVTLTNELRKRDQLDAIGGASYIAQIIDATPTAENVSYHAQIVKEKAMLRKIIKMGTEMVSVAYGDEVEVEEILAEIEIARQGIAEKLASEKRIKRMKMAGFEILTGLRKTPYESLNNAIGGFSQQFFCVGGNKGVGKTSFVMGQILYTAITEKLPAVYCGTAMPEEIFQLRMLSNLSGVPSDILERGGHISAEDKKKLLAAGKAIDEAEIHYLIEPTKFDVIRLSADLKKLKKKIGKLGIISIENFQELELRGKFKNDREEWEAIATILSGLPKELEAPVGISCQIVKDVDKRENRRPTINDLRDGGAIGAKATKVFLLYRPKYYDIETSTTGLKQSLEPEVGEVIIAKGGPPMSIPTIYEGEKSRWRDKKDN